MKKKLYWDFLQRIYKVNVPHKVWNIFKEEITVDMRIWKFAVEQIILMQFTMNLESLMF